MRREHLEHRAQQLAEVCSTMARQMCTPAGIVIAVNITTDDESGELRCLKGIGRNINADEDLNAQVFARAIVTLERMALAHAGNCPDAIAFRVQFERALQQARGANVVMIDSDITQLRKSE